MRTICSIFSMIATALIFANPTIAQPMSGRRERQAVKFSLQAPRMQGALPTIDCESLFPAAPTQSDLQVSLHVSYNKETKKFLIEGQVVNLGPDPSTTEGRVVRLIAVISTPATEAGGNYGGGSAQVLVVKQEPVPALSTIKSSGAAGDKKFFTIYKISAELGKSDDEKTTYEFQIKLSQSKSDPNPANDEARFSASNIGRGK